MPRAVNRGSWSGFCRRRDGRDPAGGLLRTHRSGPHHASAFPGRRNGRDFGARGASPARHGRSGTLRQDRGAGQLGSSVLSPLPVAVARGYPRRGSGRSGASVLRHLRAQLRTHPSWRVRRGPGFNPDGGGPVAVSRSVAEGLSLESSSPLPLVPGGRWNPTPRDPPTAERPLGPPGTREGSPSRSTVATEGLTSPREERDRCPPWSTSGAHPSWGALWSRRRASDDGPVPVAPIPADSWPLGEGRLSAPPAQSSSEGGRFAPCPSCSRISPGTAGRWASAESRGHGSFKWGAGLDPAWRAERDRPTISICGAGTCHLTYSFPATPSGPTASQPAGRAPSPSPSIGSSAAFAADTAARSLGSSRQGSAARRWRSSSKSLRG